MRGRQYGIFLGAALGLQNIPHRAVENFPIFLIMLSIWYLATDSARFTKRELIGLVLFIGLAGLSIVQGPVLWRLALIPLSMAFGGIIAHGILRGDCYPAVVIRHAYLVFLAIQGCFLAFNLLGYDPLSSRIAGPSSFSGSFREPSYFAVQLSLLHGMSVLLNKIFAKRLFPVTAVLLFSSGSLIGQIFAAVLLWATYIESARANLCALWLLALIGLVAGVLLPNYPLVPTAVDFFQIEQTAFMRLAPVIVLTSELLWGQASTVILGNAEIEAFVSSIIRPTPSIAEIVSRPAPLTPSLLATLVRGGWASIIGFTIAAFAWRYHLGVSLHSLSLVVLVACLVVFQSGAASVSLFALISLLVALRDGECKKGRNCINKSFVPGDRWGKSEAHVFDTGDTRVS